MKAFFSGVFAKIGMFILVAGVLIALFLHSCSQKVKADDAPPAIKISVFYRVFNNAPIAEVCGNVTGMNADHVDLKVVADYNSEPRFYHTFTDLKGNFCEVVMTYGGTVEVSVLNDMTGLKTQSNVIKASKAVSGTELLK
jgi:hypothetical protein